MESGRQAMGARNGEKGVERKGGQKREKIRKAPVSAGGAEPEPAVGSPGFCPEKSGRDLSDPGPGREEEGKVGSGRCKCKVRRPVKKAESEGGRKQRSTKEEKDQKESGNGGMGGARAGRRGSGFFPEKARPGFGKSRPREGRGRRSELGDECGKWRSGHRSNEWGKRP